MSNSDKWCSPPEVALPLEQFFGGPVDVDPCSNERSIIKSRIAYTRNGLALPWCIDPDVGGSSAYENFPYSQGAAWTHKAIRELKNGHVKELVRLCMFQCSTNWWADQCNLPKRNPRVLALRRLYFLDPFNPVAGQKRMTCRFEPALIYFGPRTTQFDRAFASITRWSTWGRSGKLS